jgi:hypothetical protein
MIIFMRLWGEKLMSFDGIWSDYDGDELLNIVYGWVGLLERN